MGAEDVLLPTKKELASTSGASSAGRKHGLLLDRNPYPLNAVPQVSEHQQKAIFARAESNLRRTSVRTFNTQETPDQESPQREMEKRLHETRPSGTRSNPAVNEIHPQPRADGRAREGAVDRRSKAGPTHLPCNPLESRTLASPTRSFVTACAHAQAVTNDLVRCVYTSLSDVALPATERRATLPRPKSFFQRLDRRTDTA